jgi:hypothetical protein
MFLSGAAALMACVPAHHVRAAGGMQGLKAHQAPRPPILSTLRDRGPLANAPAGIGKLYSGTPIDVLTYHYDVGRTGWNQSETDLTQASVASANFGLLTTLNVDGNVFAQPLLVSGFQMPNGTTHNVLVIATGHNSVYAYDAQNYGLLWHVNLGTSQSTNDVGCTDVKPEYGISGTPVILRSGANAATIYLVAATEPTPFAFHTQLHALDLATGNDVTPPVEISPSATLADGSTVSFDPQNQWNRAGLAAGNGSIYIGIGSHCDNASGGITGWLLRYSLSLSLTAAFHTVETRGGTELASIWMTGFAPALDPLGNLFVVTGNGDTHAALKDWGESALSLNPALSKVRGRFTPAAFNSLNSDDQDFGSGGIMLLPAVSGQTVPPMAVAMGKSGVLYLLGQTRLGGLKPKDSGALQAIPFTTRTNAGLWGGPAYADLAEGPTVYAQTDSDVLRAFSVATTGTPALTPTVTGTTPAGYGGSMPVVSSNGGVAGTAVVWLIRRTAPAELEAYNADTLGAPIFSANAGGPWSNTGQNNPFMTPMVANGRVYAPGYKTVKVFGLTP